ncbi:peptidoglycan-binding domain-containing protein [Streptomyces sp. NRRL S-340]|uniref:peptidoglycan-binding domain-containing protein n=1 Tax=Streptomyces sp. NRRL S-340 TaxID=1463901 RepID=UPI000A5D4176|nr:peptidoglycan-binding domain-containing protein [Streptomyces sp. NRRL S-340]
MEEPKGHVCPECGAPRSADNSPSCACRQRAADALRDARTAEAAAAEDFDPLRIRPYVDYGDYGDSGGSAGEGDSWGHGGDTGRGRADAGGTRGTHGTAAREDSGAPLTPGNPQAASGAGPDTTTTTPPAPKPTPTPTPTNGTDAPNRTGPAHPAGTGHTGGTAAGARTEAPTRTVPAVEATMPLRAVALPAPLTPRADAPSATDLSLFDAGGTRAFEGAAGHGGDADGEGAAPEGRRRGRRRPAALLAVSAAVVALAAACAYAGGLFSYESPARDGAAQEVREGIPDAPTSAAPATPPRSPAAAPSPSVSASASASPSATASPSASPSPSATGASPSPSGSTGAAAPGLASTTPAPTASASPPVTRTPLPPATLRRGDRGPEVSDLQERLARLYLYTGRIDGFYDQHVENSVRTYQWARGITSDGLGVYGPATRASLEAETSHR